MGNCGSACMREQDAPVGVLPTTEAARQLYGSKSRKQTHSGRGEKLINQKGMCFSS
jgi:hypothetical protein